MKRQVGVADNIKEKNIKEISKRRSSDNGSKTSSIIVQAPMRQPPRGLADEASLPWLSPSTYQQQHIMDDDGGPILLPDGRVEFSVHAIHSQIVCPLCCGTFKEPYRLTKCLHTFCKSCLWFAVSRTEAYSCPTCHEYLGGKDKWTKFALPDRTLQDILVKVLFPDVAAHDAEEERVFYAQRNIELKVELQKKMMNATTTTTSTVEELNRNEQGRRKKSRSHGNDGYSDPQQHHHQQPGATASSSRASSQAPSVRGRPPQKKKKMEDDDGTAVVGFQLVPWDEERIPSLQRSYLETSAKITVAQVKKYLQMKLQARDNDADAAITTTRQQEQPELELLCNDIVLANEVSVHSVMSHADLEQQQQQLLRLKYRYLTVAGP